MRAWHLIPLISYLVAFCIWWYRGSVACLSFFQFVSRAISMMMQKPNHCLPFDVFTIVIGQTRYLWKRQRQEESHRHRHSIASLSLFDPPRTKLRPVWFDVKQTTPTRRHLEILSLMTGRGTSKGRHGSQQDRRRKSWIESGVSATAPTRGASQAPEEAPRRDHRRLPLPTRKRRVWPRKWESPRPGRTGCDRRLLPPGEVERRPRWPRRDGPSGGA